MVEAREALQTNHDGFRRTVILEPRGSDILVGALLLPPSDRSCIAGVIFFNNVGYLGMCGHGTIGVAVTLAHLGRISIGRHSLETPVGKVDVELNSMNKVTVRNVPSYRYQKEISLNVDGLGTVVGDIAWGGNWFFLVKDSPYPIDLSQITALGEAARNIKTALARENLTGADGGEIDHVEFFGPGRSLDSHSRNYVLCPGNAYDRSPCGTGTSAKLACLAADGALAPDQEWIQESVIGSRFIGRYTPGENGQIHPSITGSAYVYGETKLIQNPGDPFKHGIGR